MKKALFIVGPTAVGKTALAVYLHSKIPSILISADSIQVYKGADIISGKDHPEGVRIELVDVSNPDESFNIREFTDRVRKIVDKNKDKTPIIVGGTGMYVKSLFSPIQTISIPPNMKLRKKLEKLGIEALQKRLKEVDPEKFKMLNDSDVNNSRRLIRAIEVAGRSENGNPVFREEEVLIVGLTAEISELENRIKKRVDERIKERALDEAKRLFKNYKNLSSQLRSANGYKQLFAFIKDEISWEEACKEWLIADRKHAKMQLTYFKKLPNIYWFDVGKKGYEDQILRLISSQFSL